MTRWENENRSGSGGKRMGYFSKRAAIGLSVTMMLFGFIAIAAQIVTIRLFRVAFLSQGIWCGVTFVVSGAFGIVAGKRRTMPWIVSHLILCVVACLFAAVLVGLSAWTTIMSLTLSYGGPVMPCDHETGYWTRGYMDTSYSTYYNTYTSTYYSYLTGGYRKVPGYNAGYYGYKSTDDINPNNNNLEPYYSNRSSSSSQTGTWTSYWTGHWTGHNTNYYTNFHTGYYTSYFVPSNCLEGDTRAIARFSLNIVMGAMGLCAAIIAIISATLSCVPLCCLEGSQCGGGGAPPSNGYMMLGDDSCFPPPIYTPSSFPELKQQPDDVKLVIQPVPTTVAACDVMAVTGTDNAVLHV